MQLRVLGPVELWDGQADLLASCRPAHRAVAALLALHANQVVSRDQLVDRVWGVSAPKTAGNLIQGYVSRLRTAFGRARGPEHRTPALRIVTKSAGYELSVRAPHLDLLVFEDLHRAGAAALRDDDFAGAAEALDRALSLWRGPTLAGTPLSIIGRSEVDWLEERRLTVVEQRAEADLARGGYGKVISDLRTVLAEHRGRERLHAHLMKALWRSGRTTDALATYHAARTYLVDEFGIEPGPDLKNLHREVLSGPPPESVSAQVPATPATALIKRRPPAQLPLAMSGFIGRTEELSRLDGLYAQRSTDSAASPLVVLSGPAGVGKTAIAVHWAHRHRANFPDGCLFVDLRGHDPTGAPTQPAAALEGFLRALGVPPAEIPASVDDRAALFRTQSERRQMLVVLDNAATAAQIRRLLPGGPTCFVVATSRSRLPGLVAREGACRILVDVLSQQESLAVMHHILGRERVDSEREAVKAVADLCGHLPLALRLAAERAVPGGCRTVADLVEDLRSAHRRLDVLTPSGDELSGIRAVLSWSYHALTPDTARMFRLLSLHPGSEFGRPAAAALVGLEPDDAQRLLDVLSDAHLVREVSRYRYRFHDLLRLYAAECARTDESAKTRAAARTRVLQWYLHSADAVDRILMPHRRRVPISAASLDLHPLTFSDPDAAVYWCDREIANLVTAVGCAAHHGHEGVAWQLHQALWSYFTVRSRWTEWLATGTIALAAARTVEDQVAEAASLASLAHAQRDLRRFNQASVLFQQSIELYRLAGDLWGEAAASTLLGLTYRDAGRQADGVTWLERARTSFAAIHDPWGEAWALYNLGENALTVGHHSIAVTHCEQALTRFQDAHDLWGVSVAASLLAQICRHQGSYDEAELYVIDAIRAARRIGSQHGEAVALYTLGRIQQDTGQRELARTSMQSALAISNKIEAPLANQIRAHL